MVTTAKDSRWPNFTIRHIADVQTHLFNAEAGEELGLILDPLHSTFSDILDRRLFVRQLGELSRQAAVLPLLLRVHIL